MAKLAKISISRTSGSIGDIFKIFIFKRIFLRVINLDELVINLLFNEVVKIQGGCQAWFL